MQWLGIHKVIIQLQQIPKRRQLYGVHINSNQTFKIEMKNQNEILIYKIYENNYMCV